MPIPVVTSLASLLPSLTARLQTVFPSTAVYLTLSPDLLKFPGTDSFVTVCPGRHTVDDHIRAGAGRVVMLIHGECKITLWSRLALDQLPREDSWLSDTTYGSLLSSDVIINALEQFQPLDGTGQTYLAMGFQLVSIDHWQRNQENVGWGAISQTWRYEFQQQLSPNS